MSDNGGSDDFEVFIREFAGRPAFERARREARPRTDLAINLNRLRRGKRLTQDELARRVGMSQPRIADIERGEANPRLDTICRLAEGLDVTVDLLFRAPEAARARTAPASGEAVRIASARTSAK